ncbi:MAG: MBL fold metallo-hydrolase [Candidatus Hodarchaeales archaeon]|jgi:ribonuclease BN (tRNA processing enzyme)
MILNNNTESDNILHFIGTGNAFAEGGRFNASYWLSTTGNKSSHTLIDCGPTTLTGIKKFTLPFSQLNRIFLTHYHGDHFAGIPFLLLDRAYLTPLESKYGLNDKFHLYGPPELSDRIKKLIESVYPSQFETLIDLCEFHVISPNHKLEFPDYNVKSRIANHSEQAIMYRFEFTNGSSFVYTGDNELTLDQLPFFKGVRYLITECTTFESQNGNHTSFKFIKKNLQKFWDLGIEKIFLVHLGAEVYENIRGDLTKNLVLSNDGMKITL